MNTGTEWVRPQGPFVAGATRRVKPTGGFAVRFVLERLVPPREGAWPRFRPPGRRTADRGGQVDVEVTVTGPLGWLWGRVLGGGLRAAAQGDLDRLATLAEASG